MTTKGPRQYADEWAKRPLYPLEYSSVPVHALAAAIDDLCGSIEGVSCLDLGCGDGRFSRWLFRERGVAHVDAVDFCPARIRKANELANDGDAITYHTDDLHGYIADLEATDTRYDFILATEVLEHLARPILAVVNAKRLLRPGGVILASVPVNLPGPTHLQLYRTGDDVRERLIPDVAYRAFRPVDGCVSEDDWLRFVPAGESLFLLWRANTEVASDV